MMQSEGSCSSGSTLRDAAIEAGKADVLDRYAADYPKGLNVIGDDIVK